MIEYRSTFPKYQDGERELMRTRWFVPYFTFGAIVMIFVPPFITCIPCFWLAWRLQKLRTLIVTNQRVIITTRFWGWGTYSITEIPLSDIVSVRVVPRELHQMITQAASLLIKCRHDDKTRDRQFDECRAADRTREIIMEAAADFKKVNSREV